jgi:hypothetical protein
MTKSLDILSAFDSVSKQQQQFVRSLFDESMTEQGVNVAGLKVYRNNLRATATQALSVSFPTVHQLIGEELFAYSAEKLLLQEIPNQGDWAKWGNGFADVLENLTQLADYPYIADCARLDFSIQQTEKAKDTSFDFSSAKLLAQVELDDLRLKFADSVHVLESGYPLIQLWNAHHGNDKEKHIQSFKQCMTESSFKQYLLVYRPQYKAEICELTESEYFWITRLIKDKSIGNALDLLDSSSFNFEQWLTQAIERNLLRAFYFKY